MRVANYKHRVLQGVGSGAISFTVEPGEPFKLFIGMHGDRDGLIEVQRLIDEGKIDPSAPETNYLFQQDEISKISKVPQIESEQQVKFKPEPQEVLPEEHEVMMFALSTMINAIENPRASKK